MKLCSWGVAAVSPTSIRNCGGRSGFDTRLGKSLCRIRAPGELTLGELVRAPGELTLGELVRALGELTLGELAPMLRAPGELNSGELALMLTCPSKPEAVDIWASLSATRLTRSRTCASQRVRI